MSHQIDDFKSKATPGPTAEVIGGYGYKAVTKTYNYDNAVLVEIERELHEKESMGVYNDTVNSDVYRTFTDLKEDGSKIMVIQMMFSKPMTAVLAQLLSANISIKPN